MADIERCIIVTNDKLFFLGWYKFNSFINVFSIDSIYMDEKFMKWFSGKRMKLKICHFLNFLF